MQQSAGCWLYDMLGGSAVRPRRLPFVLPSVRRGGVKSTACRVAAAPGRAGKRGLAVPGLTGEYEAITLGAAVLKEERYCAFLQHFGSNGCLLVSYMPLAPARAARLLSLGVLALRKL